MIIARLFEQPPRLALWDDIASVRAELFSVERLEEHARSLAAAQAVRPGLSKGHPLAPRLLDNAAYLLRANRAITEAAGSRRQVTPAAEWLIDNYHLVDMQVREIGIDLPAGYYFQLPKLAEGPFSDLPRVFGLVWSLVAHTDSHFEPEALYRYLSAYQEGSAANDRRALGGAHYAADRADREPQAVSRIDRGQRPPPGVRRTRWRTACWAIPTRSRNHCATRSPIWAPRQRQMRLRSNSRTGCAATIRVKIRRKAG